MNISNRVFTYPVLSFEKDDYKTSFFKTTMKYSQGSINSLHFDIKLEMVCPEIEKLILEEKAEYVLHIECSNTAYRKIFRSFNNKFSFELPISKVNGKMEIVSLVVATRQINDFASNDFDDDFQNIKFQISKSSILAYENLDTLDFTKKVEEFNKSDSIFSVYKLTSDNDLPMKVDLDSSKIRIGLNNKEYSLYYNLASNPNYQALFHSIVILPSLIYVFGELKLDGSSEEYRYKNWFISLEKSYASRGLLLEDVLDSQKSAIELAQEAMDLPLIKAFALIADMNNNGPMGD